MQLDDRSARRDPAITVLVVGILLALVGAAGDLIWHVLHPLEHIELFSLGSGETPWHISLFLGIALGAVGAVLWAVRLRTDGGTLLGATIALMLFVTGGAAVWTVAASPEAHDQVAAARGSGLPVADGHGHSDTTGSAADGTTDGTASGTEGTDEIAVTGGEGASHTHGESEPLTPQEQVQVDAMLADVKAATVKYKDIDVAKTDGFFQVTQFVPGMGLHMFNPKNAGKFVPTAPQLLLYMPAKAGAMKLVGVAYLMPHANGVAPEGFPGGADAWHYHENLCFLRGGNVTVATAKGCKEMGGIHQATTGWLLHAWLFMKSPEGVFAGENSLVA